MSTLVKKLLAIKKAIAAFSVGIAGWASTVVQSAPDGVTTEEWMLLGAAFVAALAVFTAKNEPAP